MEGMVAFLVTQQGQYLCWAFIFVGVVVTPVEWLFFTRIIKKTEQEISPTMSLAEIEPIEKRIKALKKMVNLMMVYGSMFIAFAVFGLTR